MLRSRRLTSSKRPRQTLTSCTEVHQKHITRLRDSDHPTNDRIEHNAMGTHGSGQHAEKGGGYSVHISPYARPATAAAITTQPISASQNQRHQLHSKPKIILNLSCLRALTCAANIGDW